MKNYENWNIQYRTEATTKRFIDNQTIMNEDEVIDYIINHCSEWINYPVHIRRGLKNIK